MSDSINNNIPFVPENTIDPAAGLNEAINTIDALLQLAVVSVGSNTPPGSPAEGARYIVGPAPTGAWAGQGGKLARFLNTVWTFFDARYALNLTDGLWYVRQSATWAASTVGLTPTFSSITLTNGQISFPATQVPSADPNTLDDYEEGTWTPVLTFTTPGNLSVVYASQAGFYTKIGREVVLRLNILTSTFTHTTASGQVRLTGTPFVSSTAPGSGSAAPATWQGITKPGYTDVSMVYPTNASYLDVYSSGSGVARSQVSVGDMPTGGTVGLQCSMTYMT